MNNEPICLAKRILSSILCSKSSFLVYFTSRLGWYMVNDPTAGAIYIQDIKSCMYVVKKYFMQLYYNILQRQQYPHISFISYSSARLAEISQGAGKGSTNFLLLTRDTAI